MTRFFPLCLAVLFLLPSPAPAQEGAPAAGAVFERLTQAMGGMDNFSQARYLMFRFVVKRGEESLADYDHAWDRHTGDYRVSGLNREGQEFLALFNINRHEEGVAYLDGKQLEGDENTLMLRNAHQRFINDSYWLIMPWKWSDPGVNLALDAPATLEGKTYDVVRLTFDDGTGLTSGDTYWAYVSRDNGLMEHWGYILQDSEAQEPSLWEWQDWRDAGRGVLLSTRKFNQERGLSIEFPTAKLTDTAPEGHFQHP